MRFLILSFFLISTLFSATPEVQEVKVAKTKDSPASRLPTLLQEKERRDALAAEEEDEFGDLDEFDEEFAASDKETEDVFDPLIGYNSWMTGVNHVLMLNVVEPMSDGYGYVVPVGGRQSVNNFFNNLYYPVSLVNNVLQLEFVDSCTETARFLINTTVGLLGFFDPAQAWFGIEPRVEDLGQTLGSYGVGSGFPIVIPFFGQKNLRDLAGNFGDAWVDPIFYVDNRAYNLVAENQGLLSIGIAGFDNFNEYSLTPGAYPKLTEDAVDLYPFLRDAYEQYRNELIKE